MKIKTTTSRRNVTLATFTYQPGHTVREVRTDWTTAAGRADHTYRASCSCGWARVGFPSLSTMYAQITRHLQAAQA